MPSLLPARWSMSEAKPAQVHASPFADESDDCVLGMEAALPALQLEGWDQPAAARTHDSSLN